MDMPWTEQDVIDAISNPLYVGLGEVPAVMDMDLWVKAGVTACKELGIKGYLGNVYDNLRRWEEFIGEVPDLGTKDEFIDRETTRIRRAVSRRSGILAMIKHLQKQYAPE